MLSYKTNILVDNTVRNLERVFEIIKDPEHFLINKHYRLGVPNGFRIEVYIARKCRPLCGLCGVGLMIERASAC